MSPLFSFFVKSAAIAVVLGASLISTYVWADEASDFFKGKQVTMYIGSQAGSGYDLYGRAVARYMAEHIPGNPTVVPSNMPGAGSIVLANFMYAKAPRDGLALAGIQNGDVMEPIVGNQNARYKPSEFTWLGSVNQQTNVCISWTTTGIKTGFDAQERELLLGVVSSTSIETVPKLMNELTATKFKLIKGYASTGAVLKAMEQGEVGGQCGIGLDSVQSSMTDALTNERITIFAQVGPQKHPDLPEATWIYDMLKNPRDKNLLDFLVGRMLFGRPFIAPPGLPADRVQALQNAFWATMKDPEFLAYAQKLHLPVLPIDGKTTQETVKELAGAAPELIERAAQILGTAR